MKHIDFLTALSRNLADNFLLYTWRDVTEVLVLSIVLYSFFRWLAKDPSKQPLLFFLGYSSVTIVAHYAGLAILSNLLLISTPVVLVLAIIMHQHTLQKNIISHKHLPSASEISYEWLDELMRAILSALNKHKEIVCVIERTDCLKEFLGAPYCLNADLKKPVLEMLFDTMTESDTCMFWVHQRGKIVATNVFVKISPDPEWLSSEVKQMAIWKRDALFLTSKTDAMILRTSAHDRTLECIVEGKDIKDLTPSHALSFLKRFYTNNSSKQKEQYYHAPNSGSFTEQQLT